MMTPTEVCDAFSLCVAIAHAVPWHTVGDVVAGLALLYGLAMSVAFFLYVYRFRGQSSAYRSDPRA